MSTCKLLQLNVTANWGSTGKIAEGIGNAAMAQGWESVIAYGRYMNPSKSKLIRVGNTFDVYTHYARNRIFDNEGLGSRKATRSLLDSINELSPDIIQLHNIHDHWLNYPLLFEYLATVATPVIWTFHDCWAFTGGCFHFENHGCYAWESGACNEACPQGHKQAAKNFGLRRKLLQVLGNRLHIISVSNWLLEYAQRSFLKDTGAHFHVLNNGIDTENTFKPTSDRKEKMILGVSNVWPSYKGFDDFKRLRELLPGDVGITLVGLSKSQIASLPEGLNGISRTANAHELAGLYSKAAVFVNPTRNDSFPTVNLEALACGTPVITYRTGGSPEAVDAATGIVVEKGDVGALAAAIMRVIDHPGLYTSEACRKRAVEYFNQETQFARYIDLYESILSGNK